jgi:hypothetical protein
MPGPRDRPPVVLGATPRTWLAAVRPAASIRSRVIRRGGGLDVHIVTCTPTANGVPAATCEHNQREHSDETAEHLLAWPRAASGTMGAPGGRPSVKGGIPGGVRGQADRCCPAGLRRLWRYGEDAMTNIRTPIGSLGAGWQRSRPAWLCTLPTPGKRHRGVPAVVTESPCCSQSSASVSCSPTPGQGVVGNGESCCSHEEVRQWETRTSPSPKSI